MENLRNKNNFIILYENFIVNRQMTLISNKGDLML